jgi:hypothetical protein
MERTMATRRRLYREPNWDVIRFFRRQWPSFFWIGGDVTGGPIRRAGYYVSPYCTTDCCRPEGPFRTIRLARRHAIKTARKIEREHYHWSRYRDFSPEWRMTRALGYLWRKSLGPAGRRR